MTIEQQIIDRILKIMEVEKTTAYRLAKDCNLSQGNISCWKKGTGKPSAIEIARIAEYFKVSTDYIITGEEKQSNATALLSKKQKEILEIFEKLNDKDCSMILNMAKFAGRAAEQEQNKEQV